MALNSKFDFEKATEQLLSVLSQCEAGLRKNQHIQEKLCGLFKPWPSKKKHVPRMEKLASNDDLKQVISEPLHVYIKGDNEGENEGNSTETLTSTEQLELQALDTALLKAQRTRNKLSLKEKKDSNTGNKTVSTIQPKSKKPPLGNQARLSSSRTSSSKSDQQSTERVSSGKASQRGKLEADPVVKNNVGIISQSSINKLLNKPPKRQPVYAKAPFKTNPEVKKLTKPNPVRSVSYDRVRGQGQKSRSAPQRSTSLDKVNQMHPQSTESKSRVHPNTIKVREAFLDQQANENENCSETSGQGSRDEDLKSLNSDLKQPGFDTAREHIKSEVEYKATDQEIEKPFMLEKEGSSLRIPGRYQKVFKTNLELQGKVAKMRDKNASLSEVATRFMEKMNGIAGFPENNDAVALSQAYSAHYAMLEGLHLQLSDIEDLDLEALCLRRGVLERVLTMYSETEDTYSSLISPHTQVILDSSKGRSITPSILEPQRQISWLQWLSPLKDADSIWNFTQIPILADSMAHPIEYCSFNHLDNYIEQLQYLHKSQIELAILRNVQIYIFPWLKQQDFTNSDTLQMYRGISSMLMHRSLKAPTLVLDDISSDPENSDQDGDVHDF
ncbi:unnamed protein product [Owenia fusiformis]|uniref:Uncharacterized protein n=1 Tax=Owenia fusiformis TaxID=6347 RepID=A0A8J1U5W3_OWEFU|nr:unnamed protein product [Owenia fusiformis]